MWGIWTLISKLKVSSKVPLFIFWLRQLRGSRLNHRMSINFGRLPRPPHRPLRVSRPLSSQRQDHRPPLLDRDISIVAQIHHGLGWSL